MKLVKRNICSKDEVEEIPKEYGFNGKLIKHIVILNPSKEQEALERYFNSFQQILGRETHKYRGE